MLQDVVPPHHYHHQPSPPLSIPSPMMLDKHRQTPHPIMPLRKPTPIPPINNTPPMPMTNTSPMPLTNHSPMPMTSPHSISNLPLTPPHSNENISSDDTLQQQTIIEKIISEERNLSTNEELVEHAVDSIVDNNNLQRQHLRQQQISQHTNEFMPVYAPEVDMSPRDYDKPHEAKQRKVIIIEISFYEAVV